MDLPMDSQKCTLPEPDLVTLTLTNSWPSWRPWWPWPWPWIHTIKRYRTPHAEYRTFIISNWIDLKHDSDLAAYQINNCSLTHGIHPSSLSSSDHPDHPWLSDSMSPWLLTHSMMNFMNLMNNEPPNSQFWIINYCMLRCTASLHASTSAILHQNQGSFQTEKVLHEWWGACGFVEHVSKVAQPLQYILSEPWAPQITTRMDGLTWLILILEWMNQKEIRNNREDRELRIEIEIEIYFWTRQHSFLYQKKDKLLTFAHHLPSTNQPIPTR